MQSQDRSTKVGRIFIVEDHPAMQRAYRKLFEREDSLDLCGVVDSAEVALQKIPELKPDLAIIDISLKGSNMDGIELVSQLTQDIPALRTLVISGYEETVIVNAARKAGASGFVAKMDVDKIVLAVREILQANLFFPDAASDLEG